MEIVTTKSDRLLLMYSRLVNGEILNKKELAQCFHVTERSIQRDIEALRCFFADQGMIQDVIYDKTLNGYRIEDPNMQAFENCEILAVCKILLESRSMRKDEMFPILDKMLSCCVPERNRKIVRELVSNEKYHYIEPHHQQPVLPGLWELGQAIQHQQVVEIIYERNKAPKLVRRRVQPVGIMFSEYYFYLTAFLENRESFENPGDLFPTIYRIDRIKSFHILNEHFKVPYKDRFQEGEFRKRVQFMYGGRMEKITFKYTGPSLESVLDRLPTAEIMEQEDDGWIIRAEVFGKGIHMWIRSQGEYIKVIEERER